MATQRIVYEVDKKELVESNKELEKTVKLNGLTQKEVEETNDKFEEQAKSANTSSKAMTGLSGQLQQAANRFQIAGKGAGDLAAGMLKSGNATGGLTKKMRFLKIAIASTGIGALVIALGALVTAFTKTQKGGDQLSKIFGQISATIDVVIGRVAQLGSGILDLITGKEGGLDKIKNSFNDIGTEIKQATEDAGKLADTQVRLRQINIEVTKDTARRSRLIQDQLIITRDFARSFADQKQALEIANKLELQNQQDFLRLANERLKVAQQELEFTPENLRTDEQRLAVSEAYAEVQNAIAASTAKQREILNRQNELETRRLASVKAIAAEEAKQTAEKDKQEQIELQKEQEINARRKTAITELNIFRLEQADMLAEAEIERRAMLLENEALTAEERELIIEESEARITDIKEKSEDEAIAAKQRGQDAINGLISQGLGDTKAAAIFEAGLNTKEAAIAAYKAVVGIPVVGPALAPVAAATATAFGLNTIAQIATQDPPQFEKGGKIGGNLHSNGGTIIEAERDEFVMSRKATSKYGFDFMSKINDLEFHPDLLTGSSGGSSINVIDTKPIADQLSKIPQNNITIDEEGFTMNQIRNQSRMTKKLKRYST